MSISDLPTDAATIIVSFLDLGDLHIFALTCKNLYEICSGRHCVDGVPHWMHCNLCLTRQITQARQTNGPVFVELLRRTIELAPPRHPLRSRYTIAAERDVMGERTWYVAYVDVYDHCEGRKATPTIDDRVAIATFIRINDA